MERVKRRGRDRRSSPLAPGGRRRPALLPSPGGAAPGAGVVSRVCECPRGPGPRGPRASYGSLPGVAVYVCFLSLCAERQEDYENDSLSEFQHQIAQPRDEMHHSTTGRLGGLLPYTGAVSPGEAAGCAVFARYRSECGVSEGGHVLIGNPSQPRSPVGMRDLLQSSRCRGFGPL